MSLNSPNRGSAWSIWPSSAPSTSGIKWSIRATWNGRPAAKACSKAASACRPPSTLVHSPVHLEIIDDEDAPPGDLLGRRGRSRCVDRLDGHREPKRRAGAGCAVDSDFAAHEVDQLAANGQAEAGTPIAAGRRCVCLTEFLKQRRLSCLRDTNAGVAHADPQLLIFIFSDCRYLD